MSKLLNIFTKTLSLRLSLITLCAIGLLLTVTMCVMFGFLQSVLKDEAMSDAQETINGKTRQIDNILLSVEQAAGNVYWDLMMNLDQPDRMEAYCEELVKCNPYISGCAIVFKPNYYPGHELMMAYVRRKMIIDTQNEDSIGGLMSKHSFTSRPYTKQIWYTEPLKKERALWVGPLKNDDTEGDPLITFSIPIYDFKRDSLVAVLAVDVSICQLSDVVLADRPSSKGYITLLAGDGSFIIHPDKEKLMYQTVFTQVEQDSIIVDGSEDTASVREAAEAMVNGETGYKPFLMSGEKNVVIFQPFDREAVPSRSMEDFGWSIGVVYPEDEISHNYSKLLVFIIVISIFGLSLFFVLCVFITHKQLKPLRLLTQSAQRIADGNYSEKVPDTRREDEIGQLQAHFQNMQQTLKVRMEEHEKLSAQLKERGEELQRAYKDAKKADRMKIAFLHFMTNQMVAPASLIDKVVDEICDHSTDNSEEMNRKADIVWEQSKVLLDILNRMIKEAEEGTYDYDK